MCLLVLTFKILLRLVDIVATNIVDVSEALFNFGIRDDDPTPALRVTSRRGLLA